ncbi:MAG TPA: APC family permease [Pyrinomonadaceae bacterium]|nr:APC family permease [Pyrinomonadaceae bacterium]
MSQETEQPPPRLVRALRLRDLVLFNLVAVLGLRHLAVAAKYGPSSLVVWLIAAVFFFVPQGLAVIELSSRFPHEGGVYAWTKRALGEGHGFLCGWCYWINNVLYYPNLLISTAVIATYVVGKGESTLNDNWTYLLTVTLISLWLAVLLNIVGVGTGRWLQNAGGVGTYVPGVILILLGVYAALTRPAANAVTAESLMPDLTNLPALNLLATIAFAFAGLELSASMGDEIENPHLNLPRSTYVAAPLIALAYIAGTGAVIWLVPTSDLNIVSGFLQAITAGSDHLGGALWWAAPTAAALYTVGNIGGVGAWLTGPARVAFAIGLDRYFPPAFARVHRRWHTPYVAILAQAVLATCFILLSVLGRGSTVEHVYLVLLDTQVLIYFIPYVYLFVSFLIHRWRSEPEAEVVRAPGGKLSALLISLSGILVTLFAMVVATIPPPDTEFPWIFRVKVIGGAFSFVLLGGVIYWRAKWSKRPASQPL